MYMEPQPDVVQVKAEDGSPWPVKVSETASGLVLGDGWSDFVQFQQIGVTDQLIFAYDLVSEIMVTVFELESGCERGSDHDVFVFQMNWSLGVSDLVQLFYLINFTASCVN